MVGSLLGPPLLLCLMAALSYLVSGGAGAWRLLSTLLANFCDRPAVFGLVLLATAWVACRRALAPVTAPERRTVRSGCASVHLWSENAIVVRELRQEARAASLLSGPLLPAAWSGMLVCCWR